MNKALPACAAGVVVALSLCAGCASWRRWAWQKPEVPVVQPDEQNAPPPRTEPPSQPEPPPQSPTEPAKTEPASVEPVAVASPTPQPQPEPQPQPAPSAANQPGQGVGLVDLAPAEPAQPPAAEPATPEPKPAPSAGQTTELVAAPGLLVNDRFVTVEEILRSAAPELSAVPESASRAQFARRAAEVLQNAIQDQVRMGVLLPEAKSRLADTDQKRVDEEMKKLERRLIAENGGNRAQLEDAFAQKGLDLAQLLQRERDRLTVGFYLQSKFAPAITISRKMLLDYYEQHLEQFSQGRQVQMQILALPLSAMRDDTTRVGEPNRQALLAKADELAKKAYGELQKGGDFGEVVRKYSRGSRASEGGVWPTMAKGSYREPAVEDAAFGLAQGQYSPILKTDSGVYIVRAYKVVPGKVVSFADAQDQIEKSLRTEQQRKLESEYLAKLQKDALVVPYQRLLELAVQRAMEKYRPK